MQRKQPLKEQFNTHTQFFFLHKNKKNDIKDKKEMHCNKMNSNTGRTTHTHKENVRILNTIIRNRPKSPDGYLTSMSRIIKHNGTAPSIFCFFFQ
jgi:hypothetical protein